MRRRRWARSCRHRSSAGLARARNFAGVVFPAVVLAAVDGLRELEGGMGEVDGKAG